MQCPFTDREAELRALEKALANRPVLAIIYGRRRIGKTRLLSTWMERHVDLQWVYFTAHLASHEQNLKMLSHRASQALRDPLLAQARYDGLNALLDSLYSRHPEAVVVIDEFTYWARAEPKVVSELQEFVDHVLPRTRGVVVVTGSLVGVMERSVLGRGAPLYARAAVRLKMSPLSYEVIRELMPHLAPAERFEVYALLGGIPYYLCLARNTRGAMDVLRELFLETGAPLQDEAPLMLREDFREPTVYATILRAVALGADTPSRIAAETGLALPHLGSYIASLERLGYLEREVPLFHKRGRLRIADPLLRTWFTLVEPLKDRLEQTPNAPGVWEELKDRLNRLLAREWEIFVGRMLLRLLAPQGYSTAGPLVHKGVELDLALLDPKKKKALAVEAHWGAIGSRKAQGLRRRALEKARQLLPQGYRLAGALVAAKGFRGGEKPPFIITPGDLERGSLTFPGDSH